MSITCPVRSESKKTNFHQLRNGMLLAQKDTKARARTERLTSRSPSPPPPPHASSLSSPPYRCWEGPPGAPLRLIGIPPTPVLALDAGRAGAGGPTSGCACGGSPHGELYPECCCCCCCCDAKPCPWCTWCCCCWYDDIPPAGSGPYCRPATVSDGVTGVCGPCPCPCPCVCPCVCWCGCG